MILGEICISLSRIFPFLEISLARSSIFLIARSSYRKRRKEKNRQKEQSSPRLRFNDHIPNSPDSLSPRREHTNTPRRRPPFSSPRPSNEPRTSTPPSFWSERLSRDRCDSSFCFPSWGAIPFPPSLSRAKGGHAPLCSPPPFVRFEWRRIVRLPPRVRTRRTVPRKPGHGPRGCTVNAWNWNYRAISTAGWYIFARVSRGSSGSAREPPLSHRLPRPSSRLLASALFVISLLFFVEFFTPLDLLVYSAYYRFF